MKTFRVSSSSACLALFCLMTGITAVCYALDHTTDSLETVKKNLAEKKAVLLDVRELEEWEEGHLKQAIHLPLSKIEAGISREQLNKLIPGDAIIYTHCAAGVRSLKAGKILEKQREKVRPLKPGYSALKKAGFPVAD